MKTLSVEFAVQQRFVFNCISYNGRSEIEECEDADASKMQARPNFVPIDQLPSFVGKKVRDYCLFTQLSAIPAGAPGSFSH